MKFNFVSDPDQIYEIPGVCCAMHGNIDPCREDDCDGEKELIEGIEFFDTGQADDFIAGYFKDFDDEKKIWSIVGEISAVENEEQAGRYVDAYEALSRIEQFAEEWNISWESEELIDEDGTIVT